MSQKTRLRVDPVRRLKALQSALEAATAELEVLRALAFTDPLTGLHNRRAFEQRLAEELSRARRTRRTFSVLVVDLDDFKLINDTRGHQEGDLVLRRVAAALRRTFREHDVVCRTGGDEFVVILPEADANAVRTALARLDARLQTADRGARLPASYGAASYPEDGTTPDALIAHADRQMYAAKRSRKACEPEYERGFVPMTVHGEETQT